MAAAEELRTHAVTQVAELAGRTDEAFRQALDDLWAQAFDAGRVTALDELQDRFCVCMK